MSIESIGTSLGIYGGTLVVCFIAGLVPFVNAELWVVGVAVLLARPAPLPAVVLLAAAGQMVAKLLLYYTALGALNLPTGRHRARVERARVKLASWRRRPLVVLWASATIGIPPFYVVTLLAGALEYRLRTFCLVGMAGRTLRFALVAGIAWLGAHR